MDAEIPMLEDQRIGTGRVASPPVKNRRAAPSCLRAFVFNPSPRPPAATATVLLSRAASSVHPLRTPASPAVNIPRAAALTVI